MKYLFKQAAGFDEHRFSKGVHEVPEAVIYHHYFKVLHKAGLVLEHEDKPLYHPPAKGAPVEKLEEPIEAEASEEKESKKGRRK